MNRSYWLDIATGKIRFGPDRARVRRELENHILDRMEAEEARGLTGWEAEKAAVSAMGDPAPLAEELGRLHRPYWGWLWRLSQWALGILLAWAVIAGAGYLRSWWDSPVPADLPTLPEAVEVREISTGTRTSRLLESWEVEGSVDLGNYRFTVPLAYLREITYAGTEEDMPAQYELVLCLRASSWRFWEPINRGQHMVLSHEASDSGGVRYGRWEAGLFSQETHRSYFCVTYEDGPFASWFEIFLDLPSEEVPDWVDIPIGYGTECLRVNLKEEVVTP